ncbi:MAG: hypothetical protein DRI94_02750 [Bacteroidetes bacterium]|nr:MAG: hypothetical protein DRI94_02750 [Bacteroidota bacterium]
MKTILSLFLSIFLFGNIFSQTTEQNIQEIRTQFKLVNSQKDFKKVYLENEEFTDQIPSEGAGLEGFYKNETIYKIVENDAVSQAVYTNQYYLKNNQLIFVYRTEKSIVMHEDGTFKGEINYDERVYCKNSKIIRHLKKGKSVLSKNLDFQKMFKDYLPLLNTKIKFEKQYNYLQGSWRNADNKNDFFEIEGLIKRVYNEDDIPELSRFWLENKYLYVHNTETKEDFKYEILELSADKLEIQDRLSREVFIYGKTKN